ncbi:hypothetical protein MNBD_GAMMA16-1568 [hydrothermal vent metagenome]|uniref:Uncharacterized protein n=1 Tax=hydrothermal vent metagenome TaxID=652676 RepID=A0A3B0ZTZ7_9ZZZZ
MKASATACPISCIHAVVVVLRKTPFGVEIKQFFQPLGIVFKTAAYVDALQHFVIALGVALLAFCQGHRN